MTALSIFLNNSSLNKSTTEIVQLLHRRIEGKRHLTFQHKTTHDQHIYLPQTRRLGCESAKHVL